MVGQGAPVFAVAILLIGDQGQGIARLDHAATPPRLGVGGRIGPFLLGFIFHLLKLHVRGGAHGRAIVSEQRVFDCQA